ncbi:adenosine monophosphate-protein transferase FICD-like [Acanthaster planci]|uniref:protein adenylyltransferase n=1 Tax=Acanthaster planci TaxID=133434 RepID=A0A8B7YNV7_ACAPL|nr:adenosine monophosphate-protein transferase FICD-like [Acanthaster planci]
MSSKMSNDDNQHLSVKSSVIFFVFGGVVVACLFSAMSRVVTVLEGGTQSHQVGTTLSPPTTESKAVGVMGDLEHWPGMDYHGMRDWPVTVRNKPLLRPDLKGEVLAALHQALVAKVHGKNEKAHKLFQHALALDPNYADALNEYGEFLEEEDILRADHLYTCALLNNASHVRALINLRRTSIIVEEIDQSILMRIDNKRNDFLKVPAHSRALQRAQQEMYYQHVYHTTAIEGNTLSLEQMRSIIETGMAVTGKSILEHNEIIGMSSALQYINNTLMGRFGDISVRDILEIHRRVLGHVDPLEAGQIRATQVFVGSHVPPPPSDVELLLEEFVEWLKSDEANAMHPVQFAALAHYKLVYIHPFLDGNGRTSRLLMNLILMRAGYPPIIVKVGQRHEYYEAIKKGNVGDIRPFIRFIARCTENMLDALLWLTTESSSYALPELIGNSYEKIAESIPAY